MHLPKARLLLLSLTAAVLLSSVSLLPHAVIPDAIAHQVELAEDVGGTLHIEPSDTPRAGEAVLAWVALTRRGGAIIPLAECDCTLDIYTRSGPDEPILSPAMVEVEAESYQGIPGAEFTFPEVGAYQLVINGSPKASESVSAFAPFELAFDVTVAAGQAIPQIPEDAAAALPAPNEEVAVLEQPKSSMVRWITIGMGSAILLGLAAVMFQRLRPKS